MMKENDLARNKKKCKDEKYIKSFLSNLEEIYKPSNIKMIALGY